MTQFALFGNPNTGKTSLFNSLTGSYEYVGNWSGVTVEKKVGLLRNKKGELIDLPGVYSLNPLSRDEGVVTQFLLTEHFSQSLNIIDASKLHRNMHLTVQLLEFGKPVIIGLNMIDVAKARGIQVDEKKLSRQLGVPVTSISARSGRGITELSEQLHAFDGENARPFELDYGIHVESAIQQFIERAPDFPNLSKRWIAVQYFEGNQQVKEYLKDSIPNEWLETLHSETEQKIIAGKTAKSLHEYIHHVRQQYIDQVIKDSTVQDQAERKTFTDRLDQIVTNKYLGIPIFLGFMYLMFMLTFDWLGFPLSDALDTFMSGPLTEWITAGLGAVGASAFIHSLILDGIVAGVGGVLVFVPQIFILFFFISFLEDSGYMARVATVMDRVMDMIGLNGKAFIPMIIGFGCNVPGVMAARTVEQPKERLLTLLLTPLMSCSARLPVYALFVGAFFAKYQALVVFSLYVLGIVIAFILAKVFSSTILKGETSFFFVELPPYRVPQFRTLWRSTWEKGKGFIKKAGTFIFAGSVIIWLLSYAGPGGIDVPMDESFLAMVGGIIAPLFAPLGFGTWQAGAALMTGFLAKEVIVSTMNIIYFVPDAAALQGLMTEHFTPLAAFSFMVFILLYIPCLATAATIMKESGSKKWTAFSIGYALVIAYFLSLIIYQGGKLIGLS
ncbi:ferrous iron transport protein B [Bacillus marinisedimentorum]|uniref:ferrous iron transport protein B n=1 Tax=Bacillus marinisedimentorum TaxID=1821260 RepID=UPI0008733BDA|nr:ferrous iron transport protein B [Bacillus marinisedimentorum]